MLENFTTTKVMVQILRNTEDFILFMDQQTIYWPIYKVWSTDYLLANIQGMINRLFTGQYIPQWIGLIVLG